MEAAVWFLAAVATATVASKVEQCPSYDVLEKIVYLPHPHDCSLFRRCQAGVPVLGHCPPGQHFNPVAMVCDEPARAGCTATPQSCSAGTPQDTCRYQCVCSRKDDTPTCPSRLEFSSLLHVFSWTKKSSCFREPGDISVGAKKLGHVETKSAVAKVSLCPGGKLVRGSVDVRHFADCAKMVRCEGVHEVVVDCPAGLLYDQELGFCDDPANVDCDVVAAPPGGCPTHLPLSSCPSLCDCQLTHGKCPASLKFAATVNITDSDTHPDCRVDPSLISIGGRYLGSLAVEARSAVFNYCPASSYRSTVYVPDLLECGRMFQCRRGQGKPFFCPMGYQFDIRANSCKRNVTLCQDSTPASTPPPPVVPCPTSTTCPVHDGSRVAHLTDCTLFCECAQGMPLLATCPPGLHFSQKAQACDLPEDANCQTFCSKLPAVVSGQWSPAQCDGAESLEGAECRLTCDNNHQLVGSDVINCTSRGWHGSGGLSHVPSCHTTAQVAQIMINKINHTMAAIKQMNERAAMLFVLDESGSVESHNFEIEKNFVAALVTAFPLSPERSSGVITFSGEGEVTVDISLRQTSTCDFLSELNAILYKSGATDMAGALTFAKDEIDYSAAGGNKSVTLVFAITDGQSQSDPADAARQLRDDGHVVFTIGVANYDRQQLEPLSSAHRDGSKLFFGLPNFEVFQVVAEYLRTTYQNNATVTCV